MKRRLWTSSRCSFVRCVGQWVPMCGRIGDRECDEGWWTMNGQWIGEYTGTNNGLFVIELDDVGDRYAGTGLAIDANQALPTVAFVLDIPKGEEEVTFETLLGVINRRNGFVVSD